MSYIKGGGNLLPPFLFERFNPLKLVSTVCSIKPYGEIEAGVIFFLLGINDSSDDDVGDDSIPSNLTVERLVKLPLDV